MLLDPAANETYRSRCYATVTAVTSLPLPSCFERNGNMFTKGNRKRYATCVPLQYFTGMRQEELSKSKKADRCW
jgi:hypothetical protein